MIRIRQQLFFIFNHLTWLNILDRNKPCLCVSVSVCASFWLSVYMSKPLIATIFSRFLLNFDRMISANIWKDTLLHFLEMLLRRRHGGTVVCFFNAALSWSQFCFYFLENYRQGRKFSSDVCYGKSIKIGWSRIQHYLMDWIIY